MVRQRVVKILWHPIQTGKRECPWGLGRWTWPCGMTTKGWGEGGGCRQSGMTSGGWLTCIWGVELFSHELIHSLSLSNTSVAWWVLHTLPHSGDSNSTLARHDLLNLPGCLYIMILPGDVKERPLNREGKVGAASTMESTPSGCTQITFPSFLAQRWSSKLSHSSNKPFKCWLSDRPQCDEWWGFERSTNTPHTWIRTPWVI